jgi:hypothetical protein
MTLKIYPGTLLLCPAPEISSEEIDSTHITLIVAVKMILILLMTLLTENVDSTNQSLITLKPDAITNTFSSDTCYTPPKLMRFIYTTMLERQLRYTILFLEPHALM